MKRSIFVRSASFICLFDVSSSLITANICQADDSTSRMLQSGESMIQRKVASLEQLNLSSENNHVLEIEAEHSPKKNSDLRKFFVRGNHSTGRIENEHGETIFQASDSHLVVSIQVSPDHAHLWVNGGDRRSYIIDASGKEIRTLPISPSDKGVLAFGAWYWLDRGTLIASSGVLELDEKGDVISCCEESDLRCVELYIYTMEDDKMQKLELPNDLKDRVFRIRTVLASDKIELGSESDGYKWYKVRKN